MSRTFVFSLLFVRRPTTIVRCVWTVIIDAVDRQFIGVAVMLSPIAEWSKLMPFTADGNAATTIVFPIWIAGGEATSTHVFPDAVKTGMFVAPGFAMLNGRVPSAAAAPANTLDQATSVDLPFGATIASAKPFPARWANAVASSDDGPSTEPQTCDINDFGHATSFIGSRCQVDGLARQRRPSAHHSQIPVGRQ